MSTACARLVLGGTSSGVGKTSLTLGLARLWARQGLRVQTFKVGPDFLDPTYLARASGRTCYNLDGWMTSQGYVRELFARATADADLALVEGVMGLFDGASPSGLEGSTAEIAVWLQAPVLLVAGAHGAARSLAATVQGFAGFEPEVRVAGVIANQGGSASHRQWLVEALAGAAAPPLVGMLPRDSLPTLPSRHLGLVTAEQAGVTDAILDQLADACQQHVDTAQLLELARGAAPLEASRADVTCGADIPVCQAGWRAAGRQPAGGTPDRASTVGLTPSRSPEPCGADIPVCQAGWRAAGRQPAGGMPDRASTVGLTPSRSPEPCGADIPVCQAGWRAAGRQPAGGMPDRASTVGLTPSRSPEHGGLRVGLACDEAFHFYYPDNLESLQRAGVQWVPFSPLADARLPAELDALYFGGGYPEVHAERLSGNAGMLSDVRDFAAAGGAVYGECGGLMYLGRSLTTQAGTRVPLAGLLPLDTAMLPRLKVLGYAEVQWAQDTLWGPAGGRCRGHEFHYSEITADDGLHGGWQRAYAVQRRRGPADAAGLVKGRVLAGYVHLHWASHLETVQHFVSACGQPSFALASGRA